MYRKEDLTDPKRKQKNGLKKELEVFIKRNKNELANFILILDQYSFFVVQGT